MTYLVVLKRPSGARSGSLPIAVMQAKHPTFRQVTAEAALFIMGLFRASMSLQRGRDAVDDLLARHEAHPDIQPLD